MSFLLPGELDCIRDALVSTLDKTANIQRNASLGQPVKGSTPDNWQAVAGGTGVACSMTLVTGGMVSGYLAQYAGLLASQQGWIVKFAFAQDVQPRDRVVIDGATYQVHAYLGPRSVEGLRRMLVTRVS